MIAWCWIIGASGHNRGMDDELLAAGFILRRRDDDDDRWLLLRAVSHGEWGFPKGHAEPGETPLRTARRECAEECGIALVAIEGAPHEIAYVLPDGRRKRVVLYPARTRQERVALSAEHDQHEWLDADGVLGRLPHAQLRTLFTHYLDDR